MTAPRTARTILQSLGLGNYTINGIIPMMFVGVSTTDPKSPYVIPMVTALQTKLGIPRTGVIDDYTSYAFAYVAGDEWNRMAWFDLIDAINGNTRPIPRYAPAPAVWSHPESLHMEQALAGTPFDFLPDVPGGLVTYAAVAGYLLYRVLKKKKGN